MSNAVYYVSYKLKKNVSIPEFLDASKNLNDAFISKQKGYVSWKQLVDGELWVDMITFETMDDLKHFKEASNNPSDLAKHFYSFMNPFGMKVNQFSIERTYE